MGYWECVEGNIFFRHGTKVNDLDNFAHLLYQYVGYVDVNEADKKHNLPCIHFWDSDIDSHTIYDFMEDHVDDIYIGEIYVKGELDEDFWRIRKFANEDKWRKEFGYITYDGDDIPLWGNTDKVQVDANALNDVL